jgi:ATP-dependent Clp protease ATP-binding subunit ClpA
MLNRELEVTLNLAFKEARSKRHEFMTVEHLLLALLDNEATGIVGIYLDTAPSNGVTYQRVGFTASGRG